MGWKDDEYRDIDIILTEVPPPPEIPWLWIGVGAVGLIALIAIAR